jgi:serine/threonine-protein kinase
MPARDHERMSDSLRQRVEQALGGQYQLEDEIGRGGMSVVYQARDVRLDRPVAIKVLPPELSYDPAIRTRFTREARTSAQLQHGHIVPIHDVGERDGIAYFVMALLTGGSLAARLAREPRQPIDEVRRLLSDIADALDYAHQRGVIHRDIKPDNILLDAGSGRALVTDFGIARAIESGTRLTITGNAVGTPTYMSPEQAMGEREVDGRSDLYSLGVLGYQMLAGRVPFSAGNSMALLLKHVSERPRPVTDFRPDTPRGLRDAIDRALMKAPEDRWPTAGTFREAVLSEGGAPAWRRPARDQVRYVSPRGTPAVRRATPAPGAAVESGGIVMVAEHLAPLTREQQEDLKLWNGRIHLLDRVKLMRWHSRLTVVGWFFALLGVAFSAEVPPLVIGPLVPFWMSLKAALRGRSLRASGLKLRRVLFMPRAAWVFPPAPVTPEQTLEKLAPREVVDSPHGAAIRRAAEEGAAILAIAGKLSKPDRARLPELEPAVAALIERVSQLAERLHRLDQGIDLSLLDDVEAKIFDAEQHTPSPEGDRRLALLERQRSTLHDLARRRATLAAQLDNAELALGSLRMDLIKLRSSGLQSAFSDVSTATQQVRALSKEIGHVLEAAEEIRKLQ